MTYRRTWFDCVLWIIYAILCVVMLASSGAIWASYLAGHPYAEGFPDSVVLPLAGVPARLLPVLGLFILPAMAVLYWAVGGIAGQLRKKYTWKKRTTWITECIVAALAFAGGLFLRIDCAGDYLSMLSVDDAFLQETVSGIEYYQMAVVTAGKGISAMRYDMAYLYVLCLSAVLSFLGNKIASAVIFQIILQAVGMALSYLVTRRIAGRIPACAVLLYLACSFSCIRMLVCFGPEWLFFDLYLIGILTVSSFVKSYCANQLRAPLALTFAAVAGILVGVLMYLEMTAVTLLLFLVPLVTGKKSSQEGEEQYCSAGLTAAAAVMAVLACALGLCGILAILACSGGTTFADETKAWISFYRQHMQFSGLVSMYPYVLDVYSVGLLVIPASFLVLAFFRSGREQNYTLWLLVCILTAPTPRAVIGAQPFGILSIYIWSVLAGLGLQNCMFGGGTKKIVQEVIEEINQTAKETGKPRFIENPLPLPKKHVRREMDYQYAVEEKDMKYDVEVAEDDDFDLP